jgi:hypothetical protein
MTISARVPQARALWRRRLSVASSSGPVLPPLDVFEWVGFPAKHPGFLTDRWVWKPPGTVLVGPRR